MKNNQTTTLKGNKIHLVPYKREHVMQYNEWMKDEYLQEMTGSEPLTLEEEYEMCKEWADDQEKLTFIILTYRNENPNEMIIVGDVNIYLNVFDSTEEENQSDNSKCAEIEVMIAEKEYRGKGIALEALMMITWYSAKYLNISKYIAKIKQNNLPSIKLFRDVLNYQLVYVSDVFNEFSFKKVYINDGNNASDNASDNGTNNNNNNSTHDLKSSVSQIKNLSQLFKVMSYVKEEKYSI